MTNRFRHELKFYINEAQYRILRGRLSAALDKDRNMPNPEGYHTRSLYFDDIYNSVCNQSIDLQMDIERELLIVDEAVKMAKKLADINKTTIEKAVETIISIEPFNQQNIGTKIKEALGL